MGNEDYPLDAITAGVRSVWGRTLSIPLAAMVAFYLAYVSHDSAEWLSLRVAACGVWAFPFLFVSAFVSLSNADPVGITFLLVFIGGVIFLFWTETRVLEAWFLLCLTDWAWYLFAGGEWLDDRARVVPWRVAVTFMLFALLYGLLRFGPGLLKMRRHRRRPTELPPVDR